METLIADENTLESLGKFLREEREKSGFTRADMSSRTRIPIDQIIHLEDGQLSSLPPVYAKGFLRCYATALSLDTEAILIDFRRLTGQIKSDPSRPLTPKYVESDINDDGGLTLGKIVIFLILLLAALGLLFFLNNSFHNFVSGYLPPALRSDIDTEDQNLTAGDLAPTQFVPTTFEQEKPVEQVFAGPGGRLGLSAEKATWVQIVVDGGAMEHIYFQPGQSRTFNSKVDLSIIAGDGQALKISWNDEDRGFLGPDGPVEKKFPSPITDR